MSNESRTSPPTMRTIAGAFVLDAALVVVFAIIGRASHDEGIFGPGGSGLWQTSWPFLVGLVLGWLISRAWLAPASPLRTGLPVWAITVSGGMVMRYASDQGVAIAFVIVATVTLLLLLVGWRTVAALIARRPKQAIRHNTHE
ncbi:DUF3054 domain-containing protein (plasmid) [Coraliomargarita sp. W4R53]